MALKINVELGEDALATIQKVGDIKIEMQKPHFECELVSWSKSLKLAQEKLSEAVIDAVEDVKAADKKPQERDNYTTRDKFAKAAMKALIQKWGKGVLDVNTLAFDAYKISDAMLRAREVKNAV